MRTWNPVIPGNTPRTPDEYRTEGWAPDICPACNDDTPSTPRYPVAVCWGCAQELSTCLPHGLPVSGYNIGIAGGFHAVHPEGDLCEETSAIGVVQIGDTHYLMGEAKFGGVVTVPILEADRPLIEAARTAYNDACTADTLSVTEQLT